MDETTIETTPPVVNTFRYRLGRLVRGYGNAETGRANFGNRLFKPTSAQALVEFVYVSIPMMFLFIGLFEFGIAFWVNGKLEAVTRDMTRNVAICGNGCDSDGKRGLTGPDVMGLESFWSTNQIDQSKVPNVDSPGDYLVNPKNIKYIWMQRTSAEGLITGAGITPTEIGMDYSVTPPKPITVTNYTSLYNLYTYDKTAPGAGYAPFKLVPYGNISNPPTSTPTNGTKPGLGWPSVGYDTAVTNGKRYYGRSICEPTHRFFVEVAYNHEWVTPINFLPGLSQPITLKIRRAMKGEPALFTPGQTAVCISD